MKLAFISDIHGNAIALDSVLADIREQRVDKIYVLGDLCYRGPEPKRSLELVRSLETGVLKGNADEWVVRGVEPGEVPDKALEMMNTEREWTKARLDPSDLDYLRQLPTEIDIVAEDCAIRLFHATPDSLFDIVSPGSEDALVQTKLMASKEADLYIYGHIHKSYIRVINGKTVINTGSIGLPFDGLAMASYALVEIANGSRSTLIRRVGYNIEAAADLYRTLQYPNAEMMINIIRNGSIG